jgi:hypothetical protein
MRARPDPAHGGGDGRQAAGRTPRRKVMTAPHSLRRRPPNLARLWLSCGADDRALTYAIACWS